MMRKFNIKIGDMNWWYGHGVLELDQAVIDAVDDDWRSMLYDLNTPEEIAAHIGWNMAVNRATLSQLDGWADQPNENARLLFWEWHDLDEIDVMEIK